MAPPYKKPGTKNPKWWANAYATHPNIQVEYMYVDGKDLVEPGDDIKFKWERGTFKFRCLAHNILLDVRWIDCIDKESGEWRSFRVEKFKGKVKPRRRRKVKNEAV
jgi:hypothetical protein